MFSVLSQYFAQLYVHRLGLSPVLRAQERDCLKVEVDVLGSPSLIVLMVSVDIKQYLKKQSSELRSCVKVEVAVLGSLSLIVLMVSVDVKQH